MRPSAGTVSARIWAIADGLSRPGSPAHRAEVVAAATREGLHEKTASTQFGAWKRALHPELDGKRHVVPAGKTGQEGVSARIKPPPEGAPLGDRHWSSLLKNGFRYGADWILTPTEALQLDRPAPELPGVYVFVLGDQVVYIGTTRRRLSDRMRDYRRGHVGQRTSARVNELLVRALSDGHIMRVLFASPGETVWNGLPVEISAGLEAGLIARFQPDWNLKG